MAKERPAPGDLELVRGFVNTLDIEAGTDDMTTPDELRGWLVVNGLLEPSTTVTVADVRRAVELREALRALLLANNGVAAPASAAAVLDNVARRARLRPRFRADGTAPLEPEADGADGSLGRLLAIVHAAMADGSWVRLKVCRSGDCWWGFWDATKNRSGAWCEMGLCGNRAKARSYRERHRGEMVG
jgi:predicted RNA-binding Zn ribbon-like protein